MIEQCTVRNILLLFYVQFMQKGCQIWPWLFQLYAIQYGCAYEEIVLITHQFLLLAGIYVEINLRKLALAATQGLNDVNKIISLQHKSRIFKIEFLMHSWQRISVIRGAHAKMWALLHL